MLDRHGATRETRLQRCHCSKSPRPGSSRSSPHANFAELGLYERFNLQPLLRADISVLGEDLLVIGEEYGGWQDARRRIDLLALDRSGRLVVIELKRTDDGGHMELQSLRYAAMVSSLGLDEVVDAYAPTARGTRRTMLVIPDR